MTTKFDAAYIAGLLDSEIVDTVRRDMLLLDAASMLRNQHEEIELLKSHLQFVERWVNHHGTKPNVTAKEALSVIQHYPPIKQITRSYEDGLVPDTPNPFELVPKLLIVLEQAESSLSDYHQNKEFGHYDLMILQSVREVITKSTGDNK